MTSRMLYPFILLFAIWLELVCGFFGLFFAASILVYSGDVSSRWSAFSLCAVALLADLVFERTLGQTIIVIGLSLIVWRAVQHLSRWRFFAYLALGIFTTMILYSGANLIETAAILLFSWMIIRGVRTQTKTREIHIR